MENISFLRELLNDNHDYWVVAKQNEYREGLEFKRGTDDIILIAVPSDIQMKRPANIDDLRFGTLLDFHNLTVRSNIYLTGNYPPFQYGVSIASFYKGFPLVNTEITKFMIQALALESHDLDDYKKLASELVPKREEKTNE